MALHIFLAPLLFVSVHVHECTCGWEDSGPGAGVGTAEWVRMCLFEFVILNVAGDPCVILCGHFVYTFTSTIMLAFCFCASFVECESYCCLNRSSSSVACRLWLENV